MESLEDSFTKQNEVVSHNDITELRTVKQLHQLRLNLDSPRMAKALENLGIIKNELANKYASQFLKLLHSLDRCPSSRQKA